MVKKELDILYTNYSTNKNNDLDLTCHVSMLPVLHKLPVL